MDIQTAARLICILKEENKTNTAEERAFNLQWIDYLREAMAAAIAKKYD